MVEEISFIGAIDPRFARGAAEQRALYKAVDGGDGYVGSTMNEPDIVEPFAWMNPVKKHADRTGIVYILLVLGECTLVVGKQKESLFRGCVVAFDDSIPHRTIGKGPSLALFLGPFAERQDDLAMKMFNSYLDERSREVRNG